MHTRSVSPELSLSRVVLGTAGFGTSINERDAFAQMDRYYEAGGRTFDTARVYGLWAPGGDGASEKCLGKWVRSRGVRGEVVLSTKGAHHDLQDIHHKRMNPECILRDLADSLENLGVESVNLYFLHRDDPRIPVPEIMDVLHEQVSAGKIHALGVSNWTTARLEEANDYAIRHGKTPFSVSQIEWSFAKLERQIYGPEDSTCFMDDESYQWYTAHRFPVMAYSSQAKGLFTKLVNAPEKVTGLFADVYATPVNRRRALRAQTLAEKYGVPVARIALAALLADPLDGCAIIAASSLPQLDDSLAADGLMLSPEEIRWLYDDFSADSVCK